MSAIIWINSLNFNSINMNRSYSDCSYLNIQARPISILCYLYLRTCLTSWKKVSRFCLQQLHEITQAVSQYYPLFNSLYQKKRELWFILKLGNIVPVISLKKYNNSGEFKTNEAWYLTVKRQFILKWSRLVGFRQNFAS